jgi:Family of unknown function (DUF5709)
MTDQHAARLTEGMGMSDEGNRESADLTDYQVLDSSDTLDGAPGDDPLDRGVVTPDRWSAAIRLSRDEGDRESLDELLAEEEPEATGDEDDEQPDDFEGDENATEEDIGRLQRAEGSDPRAGRLAAPDGGADDEEYLIAQDDLAARDEGIDGGGATAEEAAVHIVDDDTE